MTFITYFSILATIVAAILGLTISTKTPSIKWVKIYCCVNAILEIVACLLALGGIINIPIVYILVWIEVFLILQFLYCISPTISKISKRWLYLVIYLSFSSILIIIGSLLRFNPYSQILAGFIIFLGCMICLSDELRRPKYTNILMESNFWFLTGFLMYYGTSWLILLGTQYFTIESNLFIYIWEGQNILNILKNVLIIIGFLCLRWDWKI